MSWEDFGPDSRDFAADMWPRLKRWLRKPWSGHAYMNLIVEATGWPGNGINPDRDDEVVVRDQRGERTVQARHAPGYYLGHWLAFVLPVVLIALGACALT